MNGHMGGRDAFAAKLLTAPTFITSAPALTATQGVTYNTVTADDSELVYSDALTITAPTLPS